MATQAAARPRARQAKTEAAAQPGVGHNSREEVRETARDKVLSGYFDRDGNPISRKNPTYRNEFDFHPDEIPEGWVYQWIRHTVYGDPSFSELWEMQENGWRPVPYRRHANRFAPAYLSKADEAAEKNGCIMRREQLLVERPVGMNQEAFRQQQRDANGQIGDQFKRFSVPLPDNVRDMGLEGRGSIARKTNDVGQVRGDYMPKHNLEIG
jgi:hypothetical protein